MRSNIRSRNCLKLATLLMGHARARCRARLRWDGVLSMRSDESTSYAIRITYRVQAEATARAPAVDTRGGWPRPVKRTRWSVERRIVGGTTATDHPARAERQPSGKASGARGRAARPPAVCQRRSPAEPLPQEWRVRGVARCGWYDARRAARGTRQVLLEEWRARAPLLLVAKPTATLGYVRVHLGVISGFAALAPRAFGHDGRRHAHPG
jgi:hypothetical protein